MTQEEKLKEAKRLYKTANADQKYVLESLFPELKESEDERIRKELLNAFQESEDSIYMVLTPHRRESFIAWLEKQGEHAKFRDSIQVGDKVTRNEDGVLVNLSQLNRVAKKDEKQGKKTKPIEGFNTEFERQVSCLIASAINKDYEYTKDFVKWTSEGLLNYAKLEIEKNSMGISEATKKKLEDNLNKALEKETPESWNKFLDEQGEQKPVPDWMPKFLDELRSKKNYFDWDEHRDIEGGILAIIKWMNPNYFNGKGGEQKTADLKTKAGNWYICDMDVVNENMVTAFHRGEIYYCPKDGYLDVRGALFEVGCIDVFRLISQPKQKPVDWSEEDEDIINKILCICDDFERSFETSPSSTKVIKEDVDKIDNWLKNLKDRVQLQPKQNWSKEDEEILNTIINHFKIDIECTDEDDIIKWLKSLKERYTWKPSEEQIIELRRVISGCSYDIEPLAEMEEQLKKLREE